MNPAPQDAQPSLIYLNNAATTWPKPFEVLREVAQCLRQPLYEPGKDLVADYFHLLLYYHGPGERGISTLKEYEDSIREKMKIRLDPLPGNGT